MGDFLFYAVAIAIGLFIGFFLVRRNREVKFEESERLVIREWPEFKRNMRKGQLIDIRKEKDVEKEKIKGARRFPVRALTSKYQTKVRKDLPLYIYCNTGKKSYKAARKLLHKGYKKVYVLKGGFPATKMDFDENGRD